MGKRRTLNEDAVFEASDRGLWAVADGMGGHEAGDVASTLTVEMLGQLGGSRDIDAVLAEAEQKLVETNSRLIDLAAQKASRATIGTTIVGLAIAGDQYGIFWAGDSRAYRLREQDIRQLSRDHSLVQDLVEAGMLAVEEAENHPDANVVTRAVGAAEKLKVARRTGDVQSGDIFLLASDGLTKVVDRIEIGDVLLRQNPAQSCQTLLDLTLERGAPDNVSIIVVRVL